MEQKIHGKNGHESWNTCRLFQHEEASRWQLKYFVYFHPCLGEDEPNFDVHIFQLGWNHQYNIERLRRFWSFKSSFDTFVSVGAPLPLLRSHPKLQPDEAPTLPPGEHLRLKLDWKWRNSDNTCNLTQPTVTNLLTIFFGGWLIFR